MQIKLVWKVLCQGSFWEARDNSEMAYWMLEVNIYQTQETGFDHISKSWEESWKYDAQQSIFNKIRWVWKCDQALSRVFDIASQ